MTFRGGARLVDFDGRHFIRDENSRRKLLSGLEQTIAVRAYAYALPGEQLVGAGLRSCRVTFDLWEERFQVRLSEMEQIRNLVAASVEEVALHCLLFRSWPLGRPADWVRVSGMRAQITMVLELNPMSRERIERIQRWLTQPRGQQVDEQAFFGSFVSTLLTPRLGGAERSMTYRSQEFQVP
ncbi:MAG: hypothetical protein NZM37_09190 [Sandaracinaceae bacterium]|nr:hypothetical protein [Sandaracinaceae bacterium]